MFWIHLVPSACVWTTCEGSHPKPVDCSYPVAINCCSSQLRVGLCEPLPHPSTFQSASILLSWSCVFSQGYCEFTYTMSWPENNYFIANPFIGFSLWMVIVLIQFCFLIFIHILIILFIYFHIYFDHILFPPLFLPAPSLLNAFLTTQLHVFSL